MGREQARQASHPLLLLGSARSGTTLFQRILNSYDDVIIWGEHAGYLKDLANSYFELIDSPAMEKFSYPQARGENAELFLYKDATQWQAWNNWFEKKDVDAAYRNFIRSVFMARWSAQLRIWGFKEIRYGAGDRVVEMFMRLFPEGKIVIIYRKPVDVINSQLSAFTDMGARMANWRLLFHLPLVIKHCRHWNRMNLNFLAYAKRYPGAVILVSYEHLVSSDEVLQKVMARVGLVAGPTQLAVLRLKEGRGSAFSKRSDEDSSTNKRRKGFGIVLATVVKIVTCSTYKKVVSYYASNRIN